MSSNETIFQAPEMPLDRDMYVHRSAILSLARTIALEERSDMPLSHNQPRIYIYSLQDMATEAGYVINYNEAMGALEWAREFIYRADRGQSNLDDGTWSEDHDEVLAVDALERSIEKLRRI